MQEDLARSHKVGGYLLIPPKGAGADHLPRTLRRADKRAAWQRAAQKRLGVRARPAAGRGKVAGMKGRKEAVRPPYADGGFFALRSPLLPLDHWYDWGEGLEPPPTRPRWRATPRRSAPGCARCSSAPRSARPCSSPRPALDESLDLWLREPDGERGQKVERSLVATSRAWPSGHAVRPVRRLLGRTARRRQRAGRRPRDSLPAPHPPRHGLPLRALPRRCSRDPAVRAGLTVRPNSSLYRAAGRLRYAEARLAGKVRSLPPGRGRADRLPRRPCSSAPRAAPRPGELADGAGRVDPDGEVTLEEAERVRRRADRQPDPGLRPRAAGHRAGADRTTCSTSSAGSPAARAGRAAALRARAPRARGARRRAGSGADPARYRAIADDAAARCPTQVELSRLFQVDMVKPRRPADARRRRRARRSSAASSSCAASRAGRARRLDAFREAFTERYEGARGAAGRGARRGDRHRLRARSRRAGAEASPLLDGLALRRRADGRAAVSGARATSASCAAARPRALASGERRSSSTATTSSAAPRRGEPVPAAGRLPRHGRARGRASPEALDAGDFRLLLDTRAGPSGARLLGRFCHADPELDARGRGAPARPRRRCSPSAIFAEIVHLPEGRDRQHPLAAGAARVRDPLPRPLRRAAASSRSRSTDLLRLGRAGDARRAALAPARPRGHPAADQRPQLRRGSLGLYRFLCALQAPGHARRRRLELGAARQRRRSCRASPAAAWCSPAPRWRISAGRARGARRRARRPRRFAAVQALRASSAACRASSRSPTATTSCRSTSTTSLSVETLRRPGQGARPGAARRAASRARTSSCAARPRGPVRPRAGRPASCAGAQTGDAAADAGRRTQPPPRRRAGAPPLPARLASGSTPSSTPAPRPPTGRCARWSRRWSREAVAAGAADALVLHPLRRSRLAPAGALPRRAGAAARRGAARARTPPPRRCSPTAACWQVQLDTYEREVERYGGPEGIELAEQLFHADSEAVLAIARAARRRRRGRRALAPRACAASTGCSTTSGSTSTGRQRHRAQRAGTRAARRAPPRTACAAPWPTGAQGRPLPQGARRARALSRPGAPDGDVPSPGFAGARRAVEARLASGIGASCARRERAGPAHAAGVGRLAWELRSTCTPTA